MIEWRGAFKRHLKWLSTTPISTIVLLIYSCVLWFIINMLDDRPREISGWLFKSPLAGGGGGISGRRHYRRLVCLCVTVILRSSVRKTILFVSKKNVVWGTNASLLSREVSAVCQCLSDGVTCVHTSRGCEPWTRPHTNSADK